MGLLPVLIIPKVEIVSKDQQLWKALNDIEGAEAAIQFNSFNSVTQVVDALDIENIPTATVPSMFVGNYAINPISGLLAFPNAPTNHMLIRAPSNTV